MKFTILALALSAVSSTSAWRILNFFDGGCSSSGSILSGTGTTGCLDTDPAIFGIEFDPQGEDVVLDFYGAGCPGIVGYRTAGGECVPICFDGGCWNQVEVDSAFSKRSFNLTS